MGDALTVSDDISIPHPGPGLARTSFTRSYRARRTGMDVGTRRLLMAASGLGLVLVVGMGVWSLTGHRAAGVPTIEADSRPLRVKPDNPGGMTAIGASEQVLSGGAEAVGDLAPAAEKPDPQALRAQRQALAAPTAPPAAPIPITPVAAPGSDLAPRRETAPANVAAQARPDAHGALVQIAAVDSESGAATEWARLAKKMPDLLGDRRPVVQRVEQAGKAIWRVRTGGFADVAEATQFCQRVRAKGAGCSIANF